MAKKNIQYYMKLNYHIIFHELKDKDNKIEGYSAYLQEIPDINAHGKTKAEVTEHLNNVKYQYFKEQLKAEKVIIEPEVTKNDNSFDNAFNQAWNKNNSDESKAKLDKHMNLAKNDTTITVHINHPKPKPVVEFPDKQKKQAKQKLHWWQKIFKHNN